MVRSATLGDLEHTAVRMFGVLVCAAVVLPVLPRLGPVAGALAVLLGAATAWRIWRWVPESVSGSLRRRPVLAVLWMGQVVEIAVCLWAVSGPRARAEPMQEPALASG